VPSGSGLESACPLGGLFSRNAQTTVDSALVATVDVLIDS
jgi:hypothetical protein